MNTKRTYHITVARVNNRPVYCVESTTPLYCHRSQVISSTIAEALDLIRYLESK